MIREKRKKIIYLGVISADRDLQSFAEAVERVKEDYCLYLFGKFRGDGAEEFKKLCDSYSSLKYMGFFNPPKHLEFLKYAASRGQEIYLSANAYTAPPNSAFAAEIHYLLDCGYRIIAEGWMMVR